MTQHALSVQPRQQSLGCNFKRNQRVMVVEGWWGAHTLPFAQTWKGEKLAPGTSTNQSGGCFLSAGSQPQGLRDLEWR